MRWLLLLFSTSVLAQTIPSDLAASRSMVANAPDRGGTLHRDGAVWRGQWPADLTIANTSVEWQGERWAQIQWPLPLDARDRLRLLMHESFHRVQPKLGLSPGMPANSHLDTEEGRILLRLELRALRRALHDRTAIAAALEFRALRWQLFPKAEAEETALELNEGLAESTGVGLSDASVDRILEQADSAENYARSFAYYTGPAYGLLLDSLDPAWRTKIKDGSGPLQLLRAAFVLSEAATYGGVEVRTEENARASARLAERQKLHSQFVDGPVLRLPFRHMQIQFNPNQVKSIGEAGSLYGSVVVVDDWGRLEATQALIDPKWSSVTVPLRSSDWKLELKPGFHRTPAARQGDETIAQ